MKVYISGAITNNSNYKEQFEAAEDRLKSAGYEVINPAYNQGYSYKEYIDHGLFQLMHCDAIYLLKGYEQSTGATLEHDYARSVGLKVLTEETDDQLKVGDVLHDSRMQMNFVITGETQYGFYILYCDGMGCHMTKERAKQCEKRGHRKDTAIFLDIIRVCKPAGSSHETGGAEK